MLGVTQNPHEDPADQMLRELGEEMGVGDTYKRTPVGIYFGERGKTVSDPFFGGEGPDRTGCHLCGRCMVGCRHGAKNTLVKNYLYFAEKRGARVMPERTVVDIRPIGAADGSEGYEVETVRSGAWLNKERRVQRARGVVVSAGALGTNRLLQRCRVKGSLPRISDRLGELVRTNSESILTVTVPEDYHEDLIKRVAITSSVYPDPDTHIETVTYGDGGDSMRILYTLMVGDGTRLSRPLKLLGQILMHPGRLAKIVFPKHWSRRTIIILVMQTLDNAIALRPRTGPLRVLLAPDRTGPRAAEPDVHPGGEQGGRVVRQADRRHRPELGDGGHAEHPDDGSHPRRRGHRLRPEQGRDRCRPERLRIREPAGGRRVGGSRERGRQPLADHHRTGRACDEPDSRRGPGPRRAARSRGLLAAGCVERVAGEVCANPGQRPDRVLAQPDR